MKQLKAGDVRQKGDVLVPKANYKTYSPSNYTNRKGKEQPVLLVGHPILPIDLFNADFFRP